MSKKKYVAAIYLRLSKEDGDKEESYSIANQRALAVDYLKKHTDDITSYEEFVDDGYSGSNFSRPRFQEMIQQILKGKINCVVVKDLSRFAREYINAGYYLEKLFPSMNVRFISINDSIDSIADNNGNAKLIMAFKNILNDSYIRDTSIKIRSHLEIKRQNGEYIGAFVAMGYKKDKDDRHKIVIDEDAAIIIRQIFELKYMGISAGAIANKLNLWNSPSPSEYKIKSGSNYVSNGKKKHNAKWTAQAVLRILKNPIYTGTLIQGKNTTVNYKVKKVIDKAECDWAIQYNNHEAIIEQDYFDRVQQMLKRDTRANAGNEEPYLFSGFLKCGDCGDSLVRRKNTSNGKEYIYYYCARNKLKLGCTSHRVSESVLLDAVIAAINTYCKNISDMSERLTSISFDEMRNIKLAKIEQAKKEKQKEIQELENTIKLVKERFMQNKETQSAYEEVCAEIKSTIEKLNNELDLLDKDKANINHEIQRNTAWIKLFTQNGEIRDINRLLLANLVKEIVVYEDKRIVVRFNYQDKYAQLLSVEEYSKVRSVS